MERGGRREHLGVERRRLLFRRKNHERVGRSRRHSLRVKRRNEHDVLDSRRMPRKSSVLGGIPCELQKKLGKIHARNRAKAARRAQRKMRKSPRRRRKTAQRGQARSAPQVAVLGCAVNDNSVGRLFHAVHVIQRHGSSHRGLHCSRRDLVSGRGRYDGKGVGVLCRAI